MRYRFARKSIRRIMFIGKRFTTEKVAADSLEDYKEVARFSLPVRIRETLGADNEHRLHNMSLCSDLIDGTILKSKECFSLEHLIGEPTESNGFKDGPVVLNGKLGRSSGGGICQIATVLFNTALLGNLTIIEKHNHSADIWGEQRMINLGRDACFVYLRKDLKIVNNTKAPVIIRMKLDRDQLMLHSWLMVPGTTQMPDVIIESTIVDNKKLISTIPDSNKNNKCTVLTKRYIALHNRRRITFEKKELYRMIAGMEKIFSSENKTR